MQINLLCVGKLKETFYTAAQAEYQKRLKAFCKLTVAEVAEESALGTPLLQTGKEGQKLLARLTGKEHLLLLDVAGQKMDSPAFSAFLHTRELAAEPLTIVIGGPHGVSPEVLARANTRLSFSDMTFNHRLARIMLYEQLYRGFSIMHNMPYHK